MEKKPKQNIVVSFSGGETSAFMLQHILKNYSNHNIEVVFANTGEENEKTLEFVEKCSQYWNVKVTWLEYERLSFKIVDFKTAYRCDDPHEVENLWPNHPFRKYISYFGIPNLQNFSCTRELKNEIISRYLSSIGWKPSKRTIAIGIRADEIDRLGKHWYPLAAIGITKPMVNHFFSKMPFRLGLKGYEGNCRACWKKSLRKLITIARHNPDWFAFIRQMEREYENYVRAERIVETPIRFYRENKTVEEIFEMAKDKSIQDAEDDSRNTNYQTSIWHDGTELDISQGCVESCEVFTQ